MKLLTIINTVLLLAIIGWLVYTTPSGTNDDPTPIPNEAEYVVVSNTKLTLDVNIFILTNRANDTEIIEVVGVYAIYDLDDLGIRFVGNMTVYRAKSDYSIIYVVTRP